MQNAVIPSRTELPGTTVAADDPGSAMRDLELPSPKLDTWRLAVHLARGIVAVALIWFAMRADGTTPWLSGGALVGALVLFGGCPTCWIAGFGKACNGACLLRTPRP